MTTTTIDAILTGACDEFLEQVARAVTDRKRTLASVLGYTLQVGDEVEFNATTRPKYLVGVRGRVTKINGRSAVVQVGADGGRYANTSPRANFTLLTKVGG